MSDHRTLEQIHKNMAAIKGSNTKPEILVRKYLWSQGFRYRLNHPRLPGKPDLVLRKYRTCIFVNGCFWHGHNVDVTDLQNSDCCKIPYTHREFWVNKISKNKDRDIKVQHQLAEMGWHCITIWECELKPTCRVKTLKSLAYTLNHIYLQDHSVHIHKVKTYTLPEEEMQMVAEDVSPHNKPE